MPSISNLRAVSGALLAGVGALAMTACAPKPPKQLPPEPAPAVATVAPAPAPQLPAGPVPGSQADFLAAVNGHDTIHFALDKYNVDDISVSIL
jgi:peptidoglycan-associated lipoprotein